MIFVNFLLNKSFFWDIYGNSLDDYIKNAFNKTIHEQYRLKMEKALMGIKADVIFYIFSNIL